MTLLTRTQIVESNQDRLAKIRSVQINSKSFCAPAYFPKIESSIELDNIITVDDLYSNVTGFVFEIQDYNDITTKINSLRGQQPLFGSEEGIYQKFKDKVIIIDTMPEVLFYSGTKEQLKFRKLSGLPEGIEKILNRENSQQYTTRWRELYNMKMGLGVQKWIISRLSTMGADQLLPVIPFINNEADAEILLKITMAMNYDLQKVLSISMKGYEAEPSYYFAMNYRVFSNEQFKEKLLNSIASLAEWQNRLNEESSEYRRVTMLYFKILEFNSQNTSCRVNFRSFLKEISMIRDMYKLSVIFFDTSNLFGQLALACGADAFSERTTCRQKLTSADCSGYGKGSIYLTGEEYECPISYDEYVKKFKANNNLPLCSHELCKKYLTKDVIENNLTNYNKESRRIHNMLCKLDHVKETKEHIKNNDIRSIVFKIGKSNDVGMNYINPYYNENRIAISK
jgi:hypothetical protein